MTTHTYTLRDLLIGELKAELTKTRRTLERLPEEHKDYAPHERSQTLIGLANHLATVADLPEVILTVSSFDLGGPNDPRKVVKEQSFAGVLTKFDELAAESIAALSNSSDESLREEWTARRQGQPLFSGTRYTAYGNIAVNHQIHHRAQLGLYLRLLNQPVPSTFGPSADEQPR